MFSGRQGSHPSSQSTSSGRDRSSGLNPPRYSTLFGSPIPEETRSPSKSRRHQTIPEDPQSLTSVGCTTTSAFLSHEVSRPNSSFSDVHPKVISSRDYTFGIQNASQIAPWATLRLHSSEPLSNRKPKHPRFTNMTSIAGKVELSLPSSQTIRSIKLVVRFYPDY